MAREAKRYNPVDIIGMRFGLHIRVRNRPGIRRWLLSGRGEQLGARSRRPVRGRRFRIVVATPLSTGADN